MGTIDEILRLQEKYQAFAQEWEVMDGQFESLNAQYGGSRENRVARVDEIKRELSTTLHHDTPSHPDPFDARHNLRREGGMKHWDSIKGCPSCDRNQLASGRTALREELGKIYRWGEELNALNARIQKLQEKAPAIRADMNRLANGLGLPSFNAEPDGVGFILGTGNIVDFEVQGRNILGSGTYVDYDVNGRTARAILDSSEQLVAHHTGDGQWMVAAAGDRYWEKYGKPSLDQDTGLAQTNLYAGTVGEQDQKKKVHIAVNELGDVVFVRDIDGEVMYDRKHGIGHLPSDLNWDR